ncbi:hypothetical protein ScPMuIL_006986 [Solemya velum]
MHTIAKEITKYNFVGMDLLPIGLKEGCLLNTLHHNIPDVHPASSEDYVEQLMRASKPLALECDNGEEQEAFSLDQAGCDENKCTSIEKEVTSPKATRSCLRTSSKADSMNHDRMDEPVTSCIKSSGDQVIIRVADDKDSGRVQFGSPLATYFEYSVSQGTSTQSLTQEISPASLDSTTEQPLSLNDPQLPSTESDDINGTNCVPRPDVQLDTFIHSQRVHDLVDNMEKLRTLTNKEYAALQEKTTMDNVRCVLNKIIGYACEIKVIEDFEKVDAHAHLESEDFKLPMPQECLEEEANLSSEQATLEKDISVGVQSLTTLAAQKNPLSSMGTLVPRRSSHDTKQGEWSMQQCDDGLDLNRVYNMPMLSEFSIDKQVESTITHIENDMGETTLDEYRTISESVRSKLSNNCRNQTMEMRTDAEQEKETCNSGAKVLAVSADTKTTVEAPSDPDVHSLEISTACIQKTKVFFKTDVHEQNNAGLVSEFNQNSVTSNCIDRMTGCKNKKIVSDCSQRPLLETYSTLNNKAIFEIVPNEGNGAVLETDIIENKSAISTIRSDISQIAKEVSEPECLSTYEAVEQCVMEGKKTDNVNSHELFINLKSEILKATNTTDITSETETVPDEIIPNSIAVQPEGAVFKAETHQPISFGTGGSPIKDQGSNGRYEDVNSQELFSEGSSQELVSDGLQSTHIEVKSNQKKDFCNYTDCEEEDVCIVLTENNNTTHKTKSMQNTINTIEKTDLIDKNEDLSISLLTVAKDDTALETKVWQETDEVPQNFSIDKDKENITTEQNDGTDIGPLVMDTPVGNLNIPETDTEPGKELAEGAFVMQKLCRNSEADAIQTKVKDLSKESTCFVKTDILKKNCGEIDEICRKKEMDSTKLSSDISDCHRPVVSIVGEEGSQLFNDVNYSTGDKFNETISRDETAQTTNLNHDFIDQHLTEHITDTDTDTILRIAQERDLSVESSVTSQTVPLNSDNQEIEHIQPNSTNTINQVDSQENHKETKSDSETGDIYSTQDFVNITPETEPVPDDIIVSIAVQPEGAVFKAETCQLISSGTGGSPIKDQGSNGRYEDVNSQELFSEGSSQELVSDGLQSTHYEVKSNQKRDFCNYTDCEEEHVCIVLAENINMTHETKSMQNINTIEKTDLIDKNEDLSISVLTVAKDDTALVTKVWQETDEVPPNCSIDKDKENITTEQIDGTDIGPLVMDTPVGNLNIPGSATEPGNGLAEGAFAMQKLCRNSEADAIQTTVKDLSKESTCFVKTDILKKNCGEIDEICRKKEMDSTKLSSDISDCHRPVVGIVGEEGSQLFNDVNCSTGDKFDEIISRDATVQKTNLNHNFIDQHLTEHITDTDTILRIAQERDQSVESFVTSQTVPMNSGNQEIEHIQSNSTNNQVDSQENHKETKSDSETEDIYLTQEFVPHKNDILSTSESSGFQEIENMNITIRCQKRKNIDNVEETSSKVLCSLSKWSDMQEIENSEAMTTCQKRKNSDNAEEPYTKNFCSEKILEKVTDEIIDISQPRKPSDTESSTLQIDRKPHLGDSPSSSSLQSSGTGVDQAVPVMANSDDTEKDGIYNDSVSLYHENYTKEPSQIYEDRITHNQCFKWKYVPSCDLESSHAVVIDNEGDESSKIQPLRTCAKPLRIGLSRRHHGKTNFHSPLKRKT